MTAEVGQRDKEADIAVRTPGGESQAVDVPLQQEEVMHRLLDLEQARIESINHRTDLARMAVEAHDAADKRQFDFHTQRLHMAGSERLANRRLLQKVLWAAGIPLTIIVFGFLYMMFFGTDRQSDMAIKLLEIGASAVGGVGIFLFAKSLVQRFFSNTQGE